MKFDHSHEECSCAWCETKKTSEELLEISNTWFANVMAGAAKRIYPNTNNHWTENAYMAVGQAFLKTLIEPEESQKEAALEKAIALIYNLFDPHPVKLYFQITQLNGIAYEAVKWVRMDRQIIGAPMVNGILTPEAFLDTAMDEKPYPLEVTQLIDKTNERIRDNLTNGLLGAFKDAMEQASFGEIQPEKRTVH